MAISCAPADLAAAAKCFQCLPSEQKQWIDTYLLAVIAGGSTNPNTLALAAKCFQCIPPGMLRRIQAYLLCQVASGGGGTCPQDMQVAWTPTNVKLGEMLYWSALSSAWTGIQTLVFTQAIADTFDMNGGSALTSVSMPNLTNLIVGGDATMSFRFCPLLTSFSAPLWVPNNGDIIDFRSDALGATSINALLAAAVSNPTYGNAGELVQLQGGTNAAPSGAGIANKATLIGRGANITTN